MCFPALGALTASGNRLRPAVSSAMAVTDADRVQRDPGLTGKGKTTPRIDVAAAAGLD